MVLLESVIGVTSAIKDQTNAYMYDVIISPPSDSGSSVMDPQTVSKVENSPQLYDLIEFTTFQENINGSEVYIEGTNHWNQLKLENGTPGVVINQALGDKLGYNIGSQIMVENQELTITGISGDEQTPYMYINQSIAKQITGNKVSAIYARAKGDPKLVANEVQKQIGNISVQTKSEKIANVQKMTNKLLLFMGGIASIALIVGAISVINTMLISVMERTRELGILKAIGFTNMEIKGSVLFESGLLGFLGAAMGIIIRGYMHCSNGKYDGFHRLYSKNAAFMANWGRNCRSYTFKYPCRAVSRSTCFKIKCSGGASK